jgi:hypothetical protein|tara:strand:- start:51 stop:566 length:516 start_codon:yes stop_codon:yes gene_type:complete
MNNPINLAIGVAVLCCSFSCATSFTNTGLGDIFGGAGGLVTGAGNAAGDAALATADAVTGGTNLTQVSTDQECEIKCGDCTQGTWDYIEEQFGASRSAEAKAWCVGEGSGSETKFGNPCCLPPPPPPPPPAPAEIEERTMPIDSSYKGEGAAPAGGFKGAIEGYKIRKRVI